MAKAKDGAVREVPLSELVMDADTQVRVSIDEDVAEEYEAAYREGGPDALPPIDAVETPDGEVVPWDGFHRACGAENAGLATIMARVTPGTREDARWLAISANKRHGLKRSNADKRNAARMAVNMKPALSDRLLAEHAGVSRELIGDVRRESKPAAPPVQVSDSDTCEPTPSTVRTDSSPAPTAEPEKRTGKDGKSYPAPTARKKPAEKQEQVKDRVGRVVPPRLRDVFADSAVPDLAAQFQAWADLIRPDAAKSIEKRAAAYPFIDAAQVREHLDEALACLKAVASYVRDNLPCTVCPECQGAGSIEGEGRCEACRLGCGYVPEWRLKELRMERRAS